MNIFIIAGYLIAGNFYLDTDKLPKPIASLPSPAQSRSVSITFPRDRQKVRGEIKIYGKANPGASVKLQITSTYYKKAYRQEKIYKGEGPLKRMNRTFNLVADKYGSWKLDKVELTNAGWEEDFTIKATSEKKYQLIRVYDHTHPATL